MSATALKIDAQRFDVGAHRALSYESLVCGHADLVSRIAHQLLRRMPGNVELDDLVQAGMLGLLEAAQRYAVRDEVEFSSFASHRIRGAMLDSLRESDWSPRSLRRRVRTIAGARQRIETDTGQAARPQSIAAAAGLSLDEYHRTLRDCSLSVMHSLDEPAPFHPSRARAEPIDTRPLPDEELELRQARDAIQAGIGALPEFERTVLRLYYDEEFLLREIGVILHVTESRVCQVLKKIVAKLRAAARRTLDRASLDSCQDLPGVFDA